MFVVKKIIIADDHPLFREALQHSIEPAFEDIKIVNADAFVTLQRVVRNHDDSDLIMLDLHMPGAVGFSALHYLGLQYPQIPVAMISASEGPEVVARAMEFGAAGFIPKSAEISTIISAIKQIIAGERWLPNGMQEQINRLDRFGADFGTRVSTLTPKQFRILMMLTEGNLNKQMADGIGVSEATIKAHLTEVYKKLGVSNRTQAATIAAKHLQVEPIGLADKPTSILH